MKQYIQWVRNAGPNATIKNFDDDWEPIGPMVRKQLSEEGLVRVSSRNPDMLWITEKGERSLA